MRNKETRHTKCTHPKQNSSEYIIAIMNAWVHVITGIDALLPPLAREAQCRAEHMYMYLQYGLVSQANHISPVRMHVREGGGGEGKIVW